MTYYVGHSSRGLWGLVWSDFINLNLVCGIESLIYNFCENTTNYAEKSRFSLKVQFVMTLFPLLNHLYLGQDYVWFGFWEL